MITDVCNSIKNWFVKSDDDKHFGIFTIVDGVITPSFDLKTNQYFSKYNLLFRLIPKKFL